MGLGGVFVLRPSVLISVIAMSNEVNFRGVYFSVFIYHGFKPQVTQNNRCFSDPYFTKLKAMGTRFLGFSISN